jgi:hypothetical protein
MESHQGAFLTPSKTLHISLFCFTLCLEYSEGYDAHWTLGLGEQLEVTTPTKAGQDLQCSKFQTYCTEASVLIRDN